MSYNKVGRIVDCFFYILGEIRFLVITVQLQYDGSHHADLLI